MASSTEVKFLSCVAFGIKGHQSGQPQTIPPGPRGYLVHATISDVVLSRPKARRREARLASRRLIIARPPEIAVHARERRRHAATVLRGWHPNTSPAEHRAGAAPGGRRLGMAAN
jgi:hypothetical protein